MKPVFALLLALFFSCSGEVVKRTPSSVEVAPLEKSDYQGVKKKILVLPISNETKYDGEKLSNLVSSRLITHLENSNRFIIIPDASDTFGDSKEIYSSGGSKLPEVVLNAKSIGVYLVVYGRIVNVKLAEKSNEIGVLSHTNMETQSVLEIRVFDVFTNREVFAEQVSGEDDSSTFRKFASEDDSYRDFRDQNLARGLYKAVDEVAPKIISLANRLNWQGKVAKVEGQNIYLNSGRLSGLKIGDVLSVVTPGSEIFDPQTGAQLGISRGIIKATVEIVDYFGDDGALANLLSGGTIHEGDQVELY
ncbi:MAG: hypothetical protein ACHQYQ_01725 [Bacteriovoracales bacterium]